MKRTGTHSFTATTLMALSVMAFLNTIRPIRPSISSTQPQYSQYTSYSPKLDTKTRIKRTDRSAAAKNDGGGEHTH